MSERNGYMTVIFFCALFLALFGVGLLIWVSQAYGGALK